jgi:hypothetical protein
MECRPPQPTWLYLSRLRWLEKREAKHRAELNRLTETANEFREENNKLQQKTHELQVQVHQLQEDIEKRLTKIRLYARAHPTADGLQLLVSNLSEFELWINQVELIVTEAANARPQSRTIGGATRISRGYAEDGFKLYGALVSINDNRKGISCTGHYRPSLINRIFPQQVLNYGRRHFFGGTIGLDLSRSEGESRASSETIR